MATGPSRDRGSRKHVLDLLEGRRVAQGIETLLADTSIRLAPEPHPRPSGRQDSKAWVELDAETFLDEHPIPGWNGSLAGDWWVRGKGTRPTWDLLCHIVIEERVGLLLVEAKAHENELDWSGKRLSPSATIGSKRNHEQIRRCIAEANESLNRHCSGVFNLSVDSHYQLANRIAYAWKLASLGLPVVLLYLGFTGDTYFKRDYFRNEPHWQRVMGGYLQGVVSHRFPEHRPRATKGWSMQVLIRSLPVFEASSGPISQPNLFESVSHDSPAV